MTDQEIPYAGTTPTRMCDVETETYRRALRGELLQEDEPGLSSLLARGVLVANPFHHGIYVPAPPRYLETQLHASVLRSLTATVEEFAQIPAFVRELEAEQQRHGESLSPAASVHLRSVDAVNAEMIRTTMGARREILTAQPGFRPTKVLKGALSRHMEPAKRGVTVRTIYRASERSNVVQSQWVADVTAAGAEVRTLSESFPRLILVDRAHAFFEAFDEEGVLIPKTAWYSQDRAVCEVLALYFYTGWERADPWLPDAKDGHAGHAGGAGAEHKTTKLQRTILRSIVAGRGYDQIGKDLGVSERTVTVHVSKLRTALGFKTVPQLTHWWATSPERLLS
ncbi:LuxR C-terminal-related transcriptional regulator [Streptomyces sp. NPDC058525]|uniref:helix-turn-helix transcriptional regulator n=1 Tax=Streptomyces sp. NPDC058525 TaxID=3346538 RepID=UPI0036509118